MNINALASYSHQTSIRSTTQNHVRSRECESSSSDSANFSPQAFAALMQNQSTGSSGPPEMTDEMAAKIGSSMKTKNESLFKAFDGDGDGTLSTTELKSGMDSIRSAFESSNTSDSSSFMSGMPHGMPPMNDEMASKIGGMIQKHDPDTFKNLDTDNDGTLTAQEMQSGMESGKMPPPPQFAGQSGTQGMSQPFGSSDSSGLSEYKANLMNDIFKAMFTSNDK